MNRQPPFGGADATEEVIVSNEHPPNPDAATIHEMTKRVLQGLSRAVSVVDDDDSLLLVIAGLARTWDKAAGELIILAVGLSAMRYQTPERIREYLEGMKETLEEQKKAGKKISKYVVEGNA
jgi:3'-phosphoadenosine 5'-phosphosulfate (PAPS) 3'-phosphatase